MYKDIMECDINILDKYINKQLTYKELCSILNIKYYKGNSKTRQLEYIQCHYQLEKNKTKYKIIKKYEQPLEHKDKRKEKARLSNNIYYKHGIYYIVDNDKNIYIGSTSTNFGERYVGHFSKYSNITSKDIIEREHIFECLYDMTNIEDSTLIKMIEEEYITYFRDDPDYNIVNNNSALTQKNKIKTKTIKVKAVDYQKVIKILENNNIEVLE